MLKIGRHIVARAFQIQQVHASRAVSSAPPAASTAAPPPVAGTPAAATSATSSTMQPSPPPAEGGRHYTPRRACLYVPGNDEAKLKKIPGLGVDCVILDCEDGVALNRKVEARSTIVRMLDELDFGNTESIVRINSVDSGLAEEDLKAIVKAKKLVPTIMLPKVEKPQDIEWFEEKLVSSMKAVKKTLTQTINLIIFTESARGMLALESICRRAEELAELGSGVILDGVVFGSDDFCANIGAERTPTAHELLYARQRLVLIAKAFQLQAIDLVHIDYKDLEGLKTQSLEGARMGFTGKQVIHPGQVPIVQEAFSPSAQKIEWATELIKAFEEHQKSGQGAFSFRGHMIDMPLVLQARNIVQSVNRLKPATPTKV